MKKIYWRPSQVSRPALFLFAIMALTGLFVVEYFKIKERQSAYPQKLKAAQLSGEAQKSIKKERLRRGLYINREVDPAESGLIGLPVSSITSNTGLLSSKQASTNPNFAGLVVHYLTLLKAESGDRVAVALSGSFPAINISVLAALEVLELKPVIVSTLTASQWGANDPRMTWLDMERHLIKNGFFTSSSDASALGGVGNMALDISPRGKKILLASIDKSKVPLLKFAGFRESIDTYVDFFKDERGELPYVAYINVGGGTTSVGKKVGKYMFRPGLNRRTPTGTGDMDSVMLRFSRRGIPVIHLINIRTLARKYDFPLDFATLPPAGEGKIFYRIGYNYWLVAGVLSFILLVLYGFLRTELGWRLTQRVSKRRKSTEWEPTL